MLAVGASADMLVEVNANPMIAWQIVNIMLTILSVACAVIRLYKSEVANYSGVSLSALCAVYTVILVQFNASVVHEGIDIIISGGGVLLSLPHFVFYGYVIFQLGKILKRSDITFKTVLQVLCSGESRGQNEESALLNHA